MKETRIKRGGCVAAAALLILAAGSFPAAAEESEGEAETFELVLSESGESVTLSNDTGEFVSDMIFTEGEESGGTLLITEEDGTEHVFEDADLTGASYYDVIEKLSFFYVKGVDDEGEEIWIYETGGERELSEPVTMYTLDELNIRADADWDAEILGTAAVGTEVEVTGVTPIWFTVAEEDGPAYMAARYLTTDREEMEEAAAAAAEYSSGEEQAETDSDSDGDEDSYDSDTDSYYEDDVAYDSDAGGYYEDDVAYDSDAGGYYEDDVDYDSDAGGYYTDDVDADSDAGGYY